MAMTHTVRPMGLPSGIADADEAVALVGTFFLGVEGDALLAERRDRGVEVVDGEVRRGPEAGPVGDAVGVVGREREHAAAGRGEDGELVGFDVEHGQPERVAVPGEGAVEVADLHRDHRELLDPHRALLKFFAVARRRSAAHTMMSP